MSNRPIEGLQGTVLREKLERIRNRSKDLRHQEAEAQLELDSAIREALQGYQSEVEGRNDL